MREDVRINQRIRAPELRVIGADGENVGVLPLAEALKQAQESGFDLIEISPNANPPVAKIMDYGKFQYEEKKKQQQARTKLQNTETKSIQVKVGTGEHDLELKSKKASRWLSEGHRIKIDLFLRGRSKYMEKQFLEERIERFLRLLTEAYKIADPIKKSPKGLSMVIERDRK